VKWIEFAVEHPVSTIVGILLLTLFSLVAVFSLPIQMKPSMDRPIIRIQTTYLGAAPPEVEQQITDKLEEKINSVEGLRKLSSSSSDSVSQIEMEFEWGVDRDARFVDVLQKVSQAEDLPIDAEKPIIAAITSEDEDRIMWIMLQSDTMSTEEMTYFAKKEIKDTLERVDGVGDVMVFGTREREIWIVLDPDALAGRGMTISQVREAILLENQNVRGGYLDEGKTRYNLRTIGQFDLVEDLRRMVIARNETGVVYLQDIAEVKDTFERVASVTHGDTKPMIAMGVARKIGANVIEVTQRLQQAIAKLNERFANITYKGRSAGLKLTVAFQESDYIWDSLYFVMGNLWQGSLLAVIVLLFFLKSIRVTFVVSIVIPICFVANFLFLMLLNRTINIISLAGIAFAVGMTVDNSIVVVENIYRHLEMGKARIKAVLDGCKEIWSGVLASTLTTVAVFIPIVYVKDEAGELFKDIALTISISVSISFVAALTVIPMLSARLVKLDDPNSLYHKIIKWIFFIPDFIGGLLGYFFWLISYIGTGAYWKNYAEKLSRMSLVMMVKVALILVIIAGSLWMIWLYQPALEYLPSGNQNFIIVLFKTHPGTNINKASEITLGMEQKIYNMLFDDRKGPVPENRVVENMFAVASTEFNIIGIVVDKQIARTPLDELPMKVNPMTGMPFASPLDYISFRMTMMTFGTPGTQYAFAIKPGIFDFRGKSFTVEVRGPDLNRLEELSNTLKQQMQEMGQKVGFGDIVKDFELGLPEIQIKTDREKAAAFGLSTSLVAELVETMVAGKRTGKFRDGADEFDIMVTGNVHGIANIDDLRQLTFMVPGRGNTTLENIAQVSVATGPTQIFHKERMRAVTLTVNLPEEKPLSEAIADVNTLISGMRSSLGSEYNIEITGAASDLQRTLDAFTLAFILSVIVTYLLMASLFESFFYPLIIMFSVPLAISGSLWAIDYNQVPADMLTLLGFVILCGIVVNNAILVVCQTLNFIQEGKTKQEAIHLSLMSRIRPVFMSSLTTIFGMLPMCLKGAPGSELYSGLGTAIVGGLSFSTIFTLVLTPALLSLLFDIQDIYKKLFTKAV